MICCIWVWAWNSRQIENRWASYKRKKQAAVNEERRVEIKEGFGGARIRVWVEVRIRVKANPNPTKKKSREIFGEKRGTAVKYKAEAKGKRTAVKMRAGSETQRSAAGVVGWYIRGGGRQF